MTTRILSLLILTFSLHARALELGPYEISGKVKSFNDKTVTLENKQAVIEIPREFVAVKNFKSGDELNLALSPDQASKIKSRFKSPKK